MTVASHLIDNRINRSSLVAEAVNSFYYDFLCKLKVL